MEYREEDFLMLSGICHFMYCKRRWALVHIEQQWQENIYTVEGNILHERAHDPFFTEKRGAVITSRGMPVFSRTLGFSGVCDIVEFTQHKEGVPLFGRAERYLPAPVEYKRGQPKEDLSDILQLTAQVICLEEMLCCTIAQAYLYYGEIKRRKTVEITPALREQVFSIAQEMHEMYHKRHTPKVKPGKNCRGCSLADLCLPKLCGNISAYAYIQSSLKEDML